MKDMLSEGQIDDLLNYIGAYNPNYWKDGEKLACCPVHGESHPSMGISAEKGICHCFACGFSGNLAKLLAYSLPDEFGLDTMTPEQEKRTSFGAYLKAREFLKLRYELEFHELGGRTRFVKRYEHLNMFEQESSRTEVPMYKLAPLMSGKETFQYFFNRGFTKKDMKDFMIGRDLESRTVTIPVFYEDGKLAGIIGRYISAGRKKNERYKIYSGFDRGKLLYPVDKFESDGVAIIVEGQFDAIRMHRAGYKNTLALMTNSPTAEQSDWLIKNCREVLWLNDNDDRGQEGMKKAYDKLKRHLSFRVAKYPDYGKDVCDWDDRTLKEVIDSAHSPISRSIRRM